MLGGGRTVKHSRAILASFSVILVCATSDAERSVALAEMTGAGKMGPAETAFLSRNETLTELRRELIALYLALYNAGRLSVREYPSVSAANIVDVFREENLFGPPALLADGLPVEIESIACDLNAHICSREKRPTTNKNVGGFEPTRGEWAPFGSGTSLILPAIEIESLISWTIRDVRPSERLDDLVVGQRGGCESFDAECKQQIANKNIGLEGNFLSNRYVGSLSLPVLRIFAKFDISSAEEMTRGAPEAVAAEVKTRPSSDLILAPIERTSDYKVKEGIESPAASDVRGQEHLLRELGGNIAAGAKAIPFSTGAMLLSTDFAEQRDRLHKLLFFPYKSMDDYPPDLRNPVTIGVVDGWVDGAHCALGTDRFVIGNREPTPEDDRAACNMQISGGPERNHGTHVASIIGRKLVSGQDVIDFGINPFARVVTVEVDYASLEAPGGTKPLADKLQKMTADPSLRVVNMSFGYMLKGLADELEVQIAGDRNQVLYVVAAGNNGIDKKNICDSRPSCFDLPNVISVAALDEDIQRPDVLKKQDDTAHTDYGRFVHVGALGQDVFGAFAYGHYGILSGSSQAAPQVAGLASLLFAKHANQLHPAQVKNRLIACADRTGELKPKIFGGRVNAECTLDSLEGRLQLSNTSEVQHGTFRPASVKFQDMTSRALTVTTKSLQSLQRDDESDSYTLYYSVNPETRSTELEKESGVFLDSDGQELAFAYSSGPLKGQTKQIKVKEIVRYTAPIRAD